MREGEGCLASYACVSCCRVISYECCPGYEKVPGEKGCPAGEGARPCPWRDGERGAPVWKAAESAGG